MFINQRLPLPRSYPTLRCHSPVLVICRVLVVLMVLILAVVLALRGYPVGTITEPVLILVAAAVAAAQLLTDAPRAELISAPPAT